MISLIIGCDSSPTDEGDSGLERYILSERLILNPTGYAPLAAEFTLKTSTPVQIELQIDPQIEGTEPLIHRFSGVNTSFMLPILGL